MRKSAKVFRLLREAKNLAREYRKITGKPLGVTGEVAEYEAARILKLKLTPARQAGYDAIEEKNGKKKYLQIKGRCILPNGKRGQRLGAIDVQKSWHSVLMVLLNEDFDATEIREASRYRVLKAIAEPGSKARNERGALSINKFRSISDLRWTRGTA